MSGAGKMFIHNILWTTDEGCFTRESVFSVHNSHLWTRDNFRAIRERGISSVSVSVFGLVSSRTLSWAPVCYSTGRLLNDIVIFWKLQPGLPEDVPLAVRQRLWF
jgi:hypothetical protein